MHALRLLVLPLLLALLFGTAHAQQDNVRNLFFDTLRTGDVDPTPIAVEGTRYIGNQYIGGDDSLLMRYVAGVVKYDLDFYIDFRLIQIDSFYLQTYEITEMTLLGWMRLGADYLVKLEAEFPGSNMRVRWRLYDTARRQQIAKGLKESHRQEWREIGHRVSNEIVKRLTGDDGIFLTKITYAKQTPQGKELFTSDYDGTNERQLTDNGSINLSPVFHPNREEVFFISYADGDPKLFAVNQRSLKTRKIAEFKGIVAAPAISPDGTKIACVLSKDGNSEIYLLDMDGRIIKRLTKHRAIDTSPTWSPDSRLIAFASDRTGSPQIYVMDTEGQNTRRLTYEGGYNDSPIWAQRGDRITFVSRTRRGRFDLASINVSGADYRVLTHVGQNENPHFSPDGKHIVFSSTRLGTRSIFTMDITGRNQRRITRQGECSNPVWGPLP
jgi:TolB protein